MVKTGPVLIGFILTLFVKGFVSSHEFIGLIIVGFLVGYMVKEGAFAGMWNSAVAGALGSIIAAILFVIVATFGGTILGGLLGGLTGFTISGITGFLVVIGNIIYYTLVMGIAGAVGGAIAGKR